MNTKLRAVFIAFVALSVGVILAVKLLEFPSGTEIAPPGQAASPTARILAFAWGSNQPCAKMTSVLRRLQRDFPQRLRVELIDTSPDEDDPLGEQYNIRMTPTLIFLDETGRPLFRHEGTMTRKAILAKLVELGYEFSARRVF